MRSNIVTTGHGIEDLALKNDIYSLEFPFFAISKTPDFSTFFWSSSCGTKSIEIQPSSRGRATMDDKRILVFACSMLVRNRNHGFDTYRTIRINLKDYLRFIGRTAIGGKDIREVELALDRLAGTRIKTNVRDQNSRKTENFGIVERWVLAEKKQLADIKSVWVDLTISQITFDSIMSYSVLTLSKKYPDMPPFTRRIYEIGRKHCGRKCTWRVSMKCLMNKTGSESSPKAFLRGVRNIAANAAIGEYVIEIDGEHVIFKNRESL
jgi:plasmid replication initiation protein